MKTMTIVACGIFMLLTQQLPAQVSAGIITGKLPQLAYSNGADRLGSAKAGYIDTGILVKVVDSVQGNYTLQLSQNRQAYLAKNFVQPVADTLPTTTALMETWTVRGGVKYDTISIGLSRKIPYTSWMETSPAIIMVELYGVQSNTNWITQLQSAKGIRQVSWQQTENDVVQVRIELMQHQHLGYSIGYSGRRLNLVVTRKPEKASLRDFIVAIDAGHGGTNTGASGITSKVQEKDYTIRFARELEKLCRKKGMQVIMTRTNDSTIDNKDRLLYLNTYKPDLLVSFHLNSGGRSTVRGVSTYYRHVAFQPLTRSILNELLQIRDLQEFGNVGSFNFQLVQPTEYPSCLVEVAFLSNPEDEALILQQSFQEKVARKVYDGIRYWLKQLD